MKRTILSAFFTIGTALILVTTASAQHWTLAADIPFDFKVSDSEMSSGKYTVQMLDNTVLIIRSEKDQKAVITLSNAAITPQDLRRASLVFNHYGEEYFLSAVSWPEGPSRALPKTSLEIQAAKNIGRPRRLEVSSK